MDLFRLNQFYHVAKERNLRRAALKLNISKSALSSSIKYFEYSLKMQLFERVSKGMILTPQGERLFEHAKKISEENQVFSRKFLENENEIQGEIKIITTPFVGSEWLLPNLKGFCEIYQNVYPRLILKSESLNPSEADVTISPYIMHQPHLIQNHLFTTRIRLFASKEYLNKHGIPPSFQDLDHHKLITYKGDYATPYGSTNWVLHAGNTHYNLSRKSYLEVNSLHGMFNGALQGYGIAELPDYSIITNSELIEILQNEEGPSTPIYFIFPGARKCSSKIKILYDYLIKQGK